MKEWGCSPEAISISIEEFSPDDFEEKVQKMEINPKKEKMMIFNGEKQY